MQNCLGKSGIQLMWQVLQCSKIDGKYLGFHIRVGGFDQAGGFFCLVGITGDEGQMEVDGHVAREGECDCAADAARSAGDYAKSRHDSEWSIDMVDIYKLCLVCVG